MAESAGVVNNQGVANDKAFDEILAASSPAVRELARAIRALVYDVLPETVEVVWPRQGSVGWGTGPKKFTEQFAYLMPFTKHVTLGFYRGGRDPRPRGAAARNGRQAGVRLTVHA
jgi:hypothetical protein